MFTRSNTCVAVQPVNWYQHRADPVQCSPGTLQPGQKQQSRLYCSRLVKARYIFLTQIWFGKYNGSLFKVKNSCCVRREFLTINAYWIRHIFIYQKLLKRTFQTGFWVQNHLMNLRSFVVNSQMLFCSQKTDKMFLLK